MPRRRCARSNHCRSTPASGYYTRADSCCGGTKNCKGMPGRVASEQGSESSQWRHRKGLCRSMPWRRSPAQTTAAPQPPTPTAAPAAPASTAAPAPTGAPSAPAPTVAAPSARPAPQPPATAGSAASTPVGANEFSTEAQAKARCPTDTVVWVNLTSKVYHFSGTRSYGNTKHGAYMCEYDTAAAGMRAAKNETHP